MSKASKSGDRREPRAFVPGLGPLDVSLERGRDANTETKVNFESMRRAKAIYEGTPAIIAASKVIYAQLLSGGLSLKRDGETVDVKPLFRRHLDTVWTDFARDVVDHFMTFGFCVVSYELDSEESATTSLRERKRRRTSTLRSLDARNNVIPVVASPFSYKLAFRAGGRAGMRRIYTIYRTGPYGDVVDEESILFVHHAPDEAGNVTSPVASTTMTHTFVQDLVHLASVAEKARVRPPLVTQTRPKVVKPGAAASDMYFDSESREIARQGDEEENAHSARALQLQIELCKAINQHRNGTNPAKLGAILRGENPVSEMQEDLGDRMYTLPNNQEMARTELPQARGDLVDLMRMAVDHLCTAIGVPSSLLFEARYTGQSNAQMALLNATVQQLSRKVDTVLTEVYNDIYEENVDLASDAERPSSADDPKGNKEGVRLTTSASPMFVSNEILSLFTGGLADFEVAAPLALQAVGASTADIAAALERHEEMVKKQEEEAKRAEREAAAGGAKQDGKEAESSNRQTSPLGGAEKRTQTSSSSSASS